MTSENAAATDAEHPYVYARNDPLNRTDPRGLLSQLSATAQAGLGASAAGASAGATATSARQAAAGGAIANGFSYAYGPGGNHTTLHNMARDTAKTALSVQLAARYGPSAYTNMHAEFKVPRGSKKHRYPGVQVPPASARPGYVDILFQETTQKAAIWEVKSAMRSEAWAMRTGRADVVHYIARYQQAFPGHTAAAGMPMALPVPIPARPDVEVYSPNANQDGVIGYRKIQTRRPNPPPEPVPVPVPVPVPEPQPEPEPRWWEFWKWDWGEIGKWILVGIGVLVGIALLVIIAILAWEVLVAILVAAAAAAAIAALFAIIPMPECPDPDDPRNQV